VTIYRSRPLEEAHDLSSFTSGVPELDEWLRRSALLAQRMRTARTFVWTDREGPVIAYFSLAAHVLLRSELPTRIGRGSPDRIPAILLARLALDESLHGQGLGEQLLIDALSRAVAAADTAGARVAVVDAIDTSAVRFYERYGFRQVPDQPLRLVRKINDIARALG
jgi:GNAT superfamily N-acetyltransferase